MEFLGKASLYIHIFAGVLTLIAGPIAIFYNKQNKKHKVAGKVFFYAMGIVVITSVIGFVKHPTVTFYQFLLGLSVLVGFHIIRGVRSIFFMMGRQAPTEFDTKWAWMAIIGGVSMIGAAIYHYKIGTNIAFVVLFGVFGTGALMDGRYFLRILKVVDLDKRYWFQLHINSMFGAFMASTTAFAVNAITGLPWYIIWFAPTIILLPLQFYFLNKKKVSNKILGSPFKGVQKGKLVA